MSTHWRDKPDSLVYIEISLLPRKRSQEKEREQEPVKARHFLAIMSWEQVEVLEEEGQPDHHHCLPRVQDQHQDDGEERLINQLIIIIIKIHF